jgi:hypothetical protein
MPETRGTKVKVATKKIVVVFQLSSPGFNNSYDPKTAAVIVPKKMKARPMARVRSRQAM